RQNPFVSEVLAPSLELFGSFADILAESDKGVSEAMGVEIWQASPFKRFPEDRADRRSTAPVTPVQTCHLELASCPERNARRREQRVAISPESFGSEIRDPLCHDRPELAPHGKKESGERLAELGVHFPRVLGDAVRGCVNMLELH